MVTMLDMTQHHVSFMHIHILIGMIKVYIPNIRFGLQEVSTVKLKEKDTTV